MKSDLSKFRMPKKEPLEGKARIDVNKNQNLTPLDSLANGLLNPSKPDKTTDKEGVNPQKMDNSSKFLGETNPQKMDSSEKFLGETNPQPMSLEERYLGQTTPNKFDNSEKFLGETNPAPMSLEGSIFLGETTPNPSDKESKFLGETTPNSVNNTGQFLGETTQTPAQPQSQFLGETTQTPSNRESKFLGETTVEPMNRESKFLGETTPNRDNSTPLSPDWDGYYTKEIPNVTDTSKIKQGDKFKGETDPNVVQQGDKFKGETSVEPMNLEEKFKGETEPTEIKQGDKFKGETDTKPMSLEETFKGETSPTPMSLEERFLGETDPNKMDNSEKFLGETNPTPMDNSENFLGETTPTDKDSTGQFLGETNPTPMSLEERFLGETTPTDKDSTGQFLGETNPNIVQQGDKFKGETTTENVPQGDKFKGETDPTKFDNTSNFVRFSNEQISSPFATEPNKMNLDGKFLGETTPTDKDSTGQFLGETTPTDKDNTGQFLGETTPTEVEQGDKFKGETDPTVMSLGDKFKGETTPDRFPYILRQENEGKDPGEVNYIQDIHATGFTSKFESKDQSKFVGINPDNTQFDGATSLYGTLGLTNFIVDDDATGFTKDMFPIGRSKKPSQFTGVDTAGTVFDEKSSDYSNTKSLYNGLSYRPGYGGFKFDKETGNIQRYSESNKYLVDTELTRMGISQLQEMRSSPSFLDKMYDKFNLRDDAFNLGTAAFAHPLILRGIQRKGLDKGEPQKWGFGFPVDDGLVRGGIVTAVDRAVVDAVRLGKWMISVQGLLWGIKNLGLQASNSNVETLTGKRLTKVWTPINTIASSLGGFIGLHPRRHGILPLPESANPEKYETVQKGKRVTHTADPALAAPITGNRLVGLWAESFITIGDASKSLTFNGAPFARLQSLGGPNSLYGLIPGGRVPTRNENTRPDDFSGYTIFNQYATFRLESDGSRVAEGNTRALDISNVGTSEDNFRDKTDLEKKIKNKSYTDFAPNKKPTSDPYFDKNKIAGLKYDDENQYKPIGKQFEPDNTELGIKANEMPDSFLNNVITKKGKSHKIEKKDTDADITHYETIAYGNIPTREPGASGNSFLDFRSLLTGDEKKRADNKFTDYTRKHIHTRVGFAEHGPGRDLTNHSEGLNADPITSAKVGSDKVNDLVHFWVTEEGGDNRCQFRGTITGLTDTFSPSWDSVKYSGRADQGYKYGTFERSVSFNFQVYATSRDDMAPMWKKLQMLSTMTMPQYVGDGYNGTLVRFKLGDLYGGKGGGGKKGKKGKLAFIDSLTYTISDDVPWDINIDGKLQELPMGIDVAIGFKVLDDTRPEYKEDAPAIYDWKFKK